MARVTAAATAPDDRERTASRTTTDAGAVLTRVVLAAALWLVLLGFVGAVFAWVGAWTPLVGVVTAVVAAAAAVRGTRDLPAVAMPAAPAALLVLAVLAITVWTGTTRSEQVLPRRDSARPLRRPLNWDPGRRESCPIPPTPVPGTTLFSPPRLPSARPPHGETRA